MQKKNRKIIVKNQNTRVDVDLIYRKTENVNV